MTAFLILLLMLFVGAAAASSLFVGHVKMALLLGGIAIAIGILAYMAHINSWTCGGK